jgi:hypothetical protein
MQPQVVTQNWVAASESDMKLLEVAPDFVKSQAGILMTILQHLESKTKPGVKIPMQNIIKLMNNAGYSFNFQDFISLYNNSQNLRELISNYDETSLTVGKSAEPVKPADQQSADANTVDQMAKRATNK